MKRLVAVLLLGVAFTLGGFAAGKGPEINLVDNKLSIDAQAVSLGRLLRLSRASCSHRNSTLLRSRRRSDQSQIPALGNLFRKLSHSLHRRSRVRCFPTSG